jgi:SAM-dependent methyltransferase
MRRRAATGLIELLSYHAAAELLYGLAHARVLDVLRTPRTARQIAADLDLKPELLGYVLNFLVDRTDIIQRRRGRYVLTAAYATTDAWFGVLEKLVGAYGQAFRSPNVLRGAAATIDHLALARAYQHDAESHIVVDTVRALSPRGFLDLGCGRGRLLVAICSDSATYGYGIDANLTMCHAARTSVRAAGLARRVRIHHGAAMTATRLLNSEDRARIDVIHAGSLLNAHMADDAVVVALLNRLAHRFPDRLLVVVDYLSASISTPARYTQLTDLTQLLTGQGIPPSTHARWARLYRAAGARIVSASEGRSFDLRWFIHLVRLPR